MSNNKPALNPQTVLATLNEVSQTLEELTSTVSRLQKFVQQHLPQPTDPVPAATKDTQHGGGKKLLH